MTVFVRHATRPAPDLADVAGEWRDEPAWPPERAQSAARRIDPYTDDSGPVAEFWAARPPPVRQGPGRSGGKFLRATLPAP